MAYTQLLSAIPFTPATGPRLVVKPSSAHRAPAISSAVILFLQQLCRSNDIDSANANFLPSAECRAFLGHQWLLRETVQYRWQNAHPDGNRTYADFDDYLRYCSLRPQLSYPISYCIRLTSTSGVYLLSPSPL